MAKDKAGAKGSFIKPQEIIPTDTLQARCEVPVLKQLEKYCEFLQSDKHYVVTKILEVAMSKDKAFREWLAKQAKDAKPVPVEKVAKAS